MKIVIQLFAFYMLALSLAPCSDGGGGIVEIVNHLFGIEHLDVSHHEHHSNDCGDDFCPPFCICSCCSSALDTPTKIPFRIKELVLLPKSVPVCFRNEVSFSFQQSIWQPPRIS